MAKERYVVTQYLTRDGIRRPDDPVAWTADFTENEYARWLTTEYEKLLNNYEQWKQAQTAKDRFETKQGYESPFREQIYREGKPLRDKVWAFIYKDDWKMAFDDKIYPYRFDVALYALGRVMLQIALHYLNMREREARVMLASIFHQDDKRRNQK